MPGKGGAASKPATSTGHQRTGRGPFFCGYFMQDLVAVTAGESKVAAIIGPLIAQMGFDLVRVRIGGGQRKRLQIMAERENGGMEIGDCADISKAVSATLDVEDPISGAYTLEVSSPGIDRPLTKLSDFETWKGHLAKVDMAEPVEGRRRFKGVILGARNTLVRIRSEDTEAELEFTSIASARLVLTDELLEAAAKTAPAPQAG